MTAASTFLKHDNATPAPGRRHSASTGRAWAAVAVAAAVSGIVGIVGIVASMTADAVYDDASTADPARIVDRLSDQVPQRIAALEPRGTRVEARIPLVSR